MTARYQAKALFTGDSNPRERAGGMASRMSTPHPLAMDSIAHLVNQKSAIDAIYRGSLLVDIWDVDAMATNCVQSAGCALKEEWK
jgi:hypothetical protein